MKYCWLFLFLIFWPLFAHTETENIPSAPLLPLSPTIPIEISTENQQNLFHDKQRLEAEAQRNQQIFQHSSIPWIELGAFSLLLIFIILSKIVPPDILRKPETPEQHAKRVRNAALKTLQSLSQKKLPPETFYVELSNTVRQFFEAHYRLPATTQTTPEFLESLSHSPVIGKDTRQQISQFLLEADKIKFAQQHAEPTQCEKAFHIAQQFIADSPVAK